MSRLSPRPGVRRWRPRPAAGARLLCFPHAGGGASAYRAWAERAAPGLEVLAVQYPGREDRSAEALVDEMDVLAGALAEDLAGMLDRPWLVYGHSMGAAVAFETVQALRRLGCGEPDRLFVSGRRAPDRPLGGEVHRMGDQALRRELRRLGGTPEEVLSHPEMARTVLRVLRSDYRLVERYEPRPRAPLGCPITVVLAEEDPELRPEHAADWHALGAGGETIRMPGGHFFLVPHRDRLLAEIAARTDPGLSASEVSGP